MAKIGYHSSIMDATSGGGREATIRVYDVGTSNLANIYANISGDFKSNPFNTDSVGRFSFFANSGIYDIEVSGVGITTYKLEGVPLNWIFFTPPSGKCKIKNIYVDPDSGRQITEYDDIPL